MKREEELMQIKKERDEMEKHMTDMFDLAFMLNNRNDIMSPQAHYEKLARMVTHYMGSIQQSYGYMADKAIELLEQTRWIPVSERLPKDGEGHTFLVTDVNGNVVLTDFYLSSSSISHPYWNGMKMMDVIAWMPLPESYKAKAR